MQVRLLTADHPFEFGDPRLGLLQVVRGCAADYATASDETYGADAARPSDARRSFHPGFGPRLRLKPATPIAR